MQFARICARRERGARGGAGEGKDICPEEPRKVCERTEEFFEEQKIRLDIESKHDDVVRSWKSQLEQKAQEFSRLQQEMAPPRDLEMLRMKIQEELEAPHQRKVASLENEAMKYREMFYNIRREHELLKTEFEQFTADQGKRDESIHEAHVASVAALKARILELQQIQDDTTLPDTCRRLERSLKDAEVREKALEAEIAKVRKEKEAAAVARDRAVLSAEREMTELLASVKTLETRCNTAEAKAANTQAQLERANRNAELMQKRMADLERQTSAARRSAEKKDREQSQREASAAARVAKAHDEANKKISSAFAERDNALKKLVEVELKLSSSRSAASTQKRAAADKETELRKEMQAAEHQNLEVLRKAEEELRQARVDAAKAVEAADTNRSQLQAAKDDFSIQQQKSTREKERLSGRISELEKKLEDSKAHYRQAQDDAKELQGEYNKMRSKHREILAKEQALVMERERLEAANADLEVEIANMTAEQERMRNEHLSVLRENQAKFDQELLSSIEEQKSRFASSQRNSGKLRREKVKAEGRSKRYKRKALQEHNNVVKLRQIVLKLQSDFDTDRRRLERENQHLQEALKKTKETRDVLISNRAHDRQQHTMRGKMAPLELSAVAAESDEHQRELSRYLGRLDTM